MSGYTFEEHDGNKFWRLNGDLHREDGPAVELSNGDKFWYIKGKLHHEDGPAVEYFNGSKQWYINCDLHREDGPAVEISNGTKRWYIKGVKLTKEEFITKIKNKKFTAAEIASLKSYGIEVG